MPGPAWVVLLGAAAAVWAEAGFAVVVWVWGRWLWLGLRGGGLLPYWVCLLCEGEREWACNGEGGER